MIINLFKIQATTKKLIPLERPNNYETLKFAVSKPFTNPLKLRI